MRAIHYVPLGPPLCLYPPRPLGGPFCAPPRFSARGHWVLAIGAPLSLPSDQINHRNLAVLTAV